MTKTPPPTWKERQRLASRLQREVDKVHGKDSDGDHYAVVEVHDRRDGYWPYIRPVPRIPFDDPTPEQMMEAIDAAGGNVESTSRLFDQVRRDVQCYFEKDKRQRAIREAAKLILGSSVRIGQAYSVYSDAPQWHRWMSYKVNRDRGGIVTPETCYFNDVNQFNIEAFKTWLKAGRAALVKTYKRKHIKGWYVRTDGCLGSSLAALVETPKESRPYHIARNRAKNKCLERHAEEIEAEAVRIEAEIREKGEV